MTVYSRDHAKLGKASKLLDDLDHSIEKIHKQDVDRTDSFVENSFIKIRDNIKNSLYNLRKINQTTQSTHYPLFEIDIHEKTEVILNLINKLKKDSSVINNIPNLSLEFLILESQTKDLFSDIEHKILIKQIEEDTKRLGKALSTRKETASVVALINLEKRYQESSCEHSKKSFNYRRRSYIFSFILGVVLVSFYFGWFSPVITDKQDWITSLLLRYSIIFFLIFLISYFIHHTNKQQKTAQHYKQLELQINLLSLYLDRIDTDKSEDQKEYLRRIGEKYFTGLPPLDSEKESLQGVPYNELLSIIRTLTNKK